GRRRADDVADRREGDRALDVPARPGHRAPVARGSAPGGGRASVSWLGSKQNGTPRTGVLLCEGPPARHALSPPVGVPNGFCPRPRGGGEGGGGGAGGSWYFPPPHPDPLPHSLQEMCGLDALRPWGRGRGASALPSQTLRRAFRVFWGRLSPG